MTKKRPLAVTVAGVRVSVYLDDDERPRSANAGIDRPGDIDHERVGTLAATMALETARSGWQRAKRKRSSDKAAAESAQQRRAASAEHWANDWLARADDAHRG